MTLKEYLTQLQELADQNPEALEMVVVTSRDDEGNGYNAVHYSPSMGRFEDGDFDAADLPNAVCLN